MFPSMLNLKRSILPFSDLIDKAFIIKSSSKRAPSSKHKRLKKNKFNKEKGSRLGLKKNKF